MEGQGDKAMKLENYILARVLISRKGAKTQRFFFAAQRLRGFGSLY